MLRPKVEVAISGVLSQLLDYIHSYEQRKEPMGLDKFFTCTAFDIVGEVSYSKPFRFLKEYKDVNNAIAIDLSLASSQVAGAGDMGLPPARAVLHRRQPHHDLSASDSGLMAGRASSRSRQGPCGPPGRRLRYVQSLVRIR